MYMTPHTAVRGSFRTLEIDHKHGLFSQTTLDVRLFVVIMCNWCCSVHRVLVQVTYIVGFGLVEMAISTNPKPTIYRNSCDNTGPVRHDTLNRHHGVKRSYFPLPSHAKHTIMSRPSWNNKSVIAVMSQKERTGDRTCRGISHEQTPNVLIIWTYVTR